MKILLAGIGKMANAFAVECSKQKIDCVRILDESELQKKYAPENHVMVHFGSGELLLAMTELSVKNGIPIIQGSTNSKSVEVMNSAKGAKIINAPNLSLPMVVLMANVGSLMKPLSEIMHPEIAESHQVDKKDKISGTARAVADILEIVHSKISYVRDKVIQRNFLGVPERFLDGHAYHSFTFTGSGVTIRIETKIHGRETYARGAIDIARGLNLVMNDQPDLILAKVTNLIDLPMWVYAPKKKKINTVH
jgi:4-hydroxy-tetrahydrodipicolinate reductase